MAAAGVRVGLPLSQARALVSELLHRVMIAEADPGRDAAGLAALARWCDRFSPCVAVDPPDGLLMDIGGCEHLFGGERALARSMLGSLTRLGFDTRLAIAPSFAGARALARFGRGTAEDRICIVHPPHLRDALARLPVESLGVDETTRAGLALVGVRTIADLLAIPRATLPARFGEDLLLRLDRALGAAIETISPVRTQAPVRVERVFDGSTTRLGDLECCLRQMLEQLIEKLAACESGVRRLDVTLDRTDLGPWTFTIALSRPSRERRHLWSLLRSGLERSHLGFGVQGIALHAVHAGRLVHEQMSTEGIVPCDGAIDSAERARAASELIDTLAARLGVDRVVRPTLAESHLPERAASYRSAIASVPLDHAGTPGLSPADRPPLLFAMPHEIGVVALTPDGPIHRVRLGEQELEISACHGPERLGPEWWRSDGSGAASTRDYFRVRDQHGRWLWVFRAYRNTIAGEEQRPAARWFVHGVWS